MDSIDTTRAVVEIGQKHDLMYDQITELANEVGLVLLGLTPSPMFVSNISRRMKVDINKATLIARDLNAQVFDKMRDSMKKIESAENGAPNHAATVAETAPEQSEETMVTDAQKAMKKSVVEGIEAAGGFVIDKPVKDNGMNNIETKKQVLDEIEKDTSVASNQITEEKGPSIVDTLLSKGVAIPMDAEAPKPQEKKKPYDGTDPYREPTE